MPEAMAEGFAWGFLFAQVAMLAFVLRVVPRRVGPDWKRQLGVRWPAAFHVFLIVLLLPGFMILPTGFAELLSKWTGAKPLPGLDALKQVFQQWPRWLTVLAVGVGPGVVEELWCRGFLGRGLCARYGLVIGIILTSLLFGYLHLHPIYAIVYAAMGAYLHFTYLCSRSIWVPILLHALNNGVAAVLELAGAELRLGPDQPLAPLVYLLSGSLLVFAGVALWTGRAEVQSYSTRPIDWQPEYPGISAPPAGVEARMGYQTPSPVAVVNSLACCGALIYLLLR
jgi:membrane protease YdiL (CAAX protease family)